MKRLLTTLVIFVGLQVGLFAQTFTTLYSFAGGADGYIPSGQLILDAQGNLYGATVQGGIVGPGCGIDGCGTIFELSLVNGVWTKTTIYEFQGGAAGAYPKAPLVFDSAGNLYGTTQVGGNKNSCGIVFEISQGVETVLHTFKGKDGCEPAAGLAIDAAGNLYGTTVSGGLSTTCGGSSCGTIFKLTATGGQWTFQVLAQFSDLFFLSDGPLVLDAAGNLYGTTMYGQGKKGYDGIGVAFKLYLVNGKWNHQFLHKFKYRYIKPYGGLAFDSAGNLYGVTTKGGGDAGSVYELSPTANAWECTFLEKFTAGDVPVSGITVDADRNLYGVIEGGANGKGELFKMIRQGNGWAYSDLHDFDAGDPGAWGNVILDGSGNIYGVTGGDGVTSFGSVYEFQQ